MVLDVDVDKFVDLDCRVNYFVAGNCHDLMVLQYSAYHCNFYYEHIKHAQVLVFMNCWLLGVKVLAIMHEYRFLVVNNSPYLSSLENWIFSGLV